MHLSLGLRYRVCARRMSNGVHYCLRVEYPWALEGTPLWERPLLTRMHVLERTSRYFPSIKFFGVLQAAIVCQVGTSIMCNFIQFLAMLFPKSRVKVGWSYSIWLSDRKRRWRSRGWSVGRWLFHPKRSCNNIQGRNYSPWNYHLELSSHSNLNRLLRGKVQVHPCKCVLG